MMQPNTDALKVNHKLAQFQAALKAYMITDEIVEWIFPKSDDNSRSDDINGKVSTTACSHYLQGKTAIHFAFDHDNVGAFQILLRHGADFLVTDENNSTIAHIAVQSSGGTCYYSESQNRTNKLFINNILSTQVKSGNITNFCNNYGISHFHAACMSNNVEAVNFFLKNGAPINHTVNEDSSCFAGFSPIHFASIECNLKVVEVLLEHGANVCIKDSRGMTPLHIVLKSSFDTIDKSRVTWCQDLGTTNSSWDEVKHLLIENIANNNTIIDESGLSLVHIACTITNFSLSGKLLKKCTNINLPVSTESALWPGYTALHFAVHFNLNTVKLLVQKGADLQAKDSKGVTPLDLCVKKYKEEDVYAILSMKKIWKNILLSDKKTKLLDVIVAMKDCNQFSKFLRRLSKNFNIMIPVDSPLWPSFTLLHLAVLFYKPVHRQYSCDRNVVNKNIQIIRELFSKNSDLISVQDVHGCTPIHMSFKLKKDNNLIDLLLEMYQKLDDPHDLVDKDNLSLLHIACARNNQILVEMLLKSTKNVNLVYKGKTNHGLVESGWTPLHIAVAHNAEHVIETLLKNGSEIYAKDANGQTSIHLVLIYDTTEIGRILLSTKRLKDEVVDDTRLSHLHVACFCGDVDAVKKLLDASADLNNLYTSNSNRDYKNCSPLQMALESNREKIVDLLIQKGANIFVDAASGVPLIYASLCGFEFQDSRQCFASLLKQNTNLRERVESEIGLTKLHLACAVNDTSYIKNLLDNGAKINAKMNLDSPIWPGYTPLHILIRYQYENEEILYTVQLMLSKGANVTLTDAKHETPLLKAYKLYASNLRYNSRDRIKIALELVSILLNAQTDFTVNPASIEGITHFHVACNMSDTFVVEKFLEQGVAELNHPIDFFSQHNYKDQQTGYTPLHLAVTSDTEFIDSTSQLETVDLLLKYGADVNAQDSKGNTPLHIAYCFEIFERIMRANADTSVINACGRRPIEHLLTNNNSIENLKKWLRCGCYYNVYNITSGKGFIASSLNRKRISFDDMLLFMSTIVINIPRAIQPDEMGRTVIHNIASSYDFVSTNEYATLIDQFSKAGFDVDDQDKLGRTPLHIAAKFTNFEAISGLLMAGADINIKDINGLTPMAYSFEKCIRFDGMNYQVDDECEHSKMFKALAIHVKKLQFCNLDVCEFNQVRVLRAFEIITSHTVDEQFFKEIEELENFKIKGYSISLRNLLSETDLVADYPNMSHLKRIAVDKFFRSTNEIRNLRQKLGQVAGIIQLQYKKAVMRSQLLEPAKSSLRFLSGFSLPDLCFHILAESLTNTDLKNLIVSTT